jgi:hypothetical protein
MKHGALIALGLVLLYGWMTALPLFGDSLYLTTTRLNVGTFSDYLGALNPRVDPAQEAARVVPLYRPFFLEFIVPLVQAGPLRTPPAVYALVLAGGLATAMVLYVLSFRLSGCQDSAFVVAAFVAFHPALFEVFLAGYAGLNCVVTYLLIALGLVCAWRFAERPGWGALAAVVIAGFLGAFSWERASLLPFALLLVVVGGRLVGERPGVGLAGLAQGLGTVRVAALITACAGTTALYFAARAARFGTPVASHHGSGALTVEALVKQAGALGLGAIGILPPYVPGWFGVGFGSLPWPAGLLLVTYGLLVTGFAGYCLWRRPLVGALGCAVATVLLLPNAAARQVLMMRYADMLVLGLAIVLSSAPMLSWASRAARLWLTLAAVGLLVAVAATHELVTWRSPDHFLVRGAQAATAVRTALAATPVATRERDIYLMSGFFNHDAMWVFSATPSRLGSFVSANFPVDRARVGRFSPAALTGRPAVLVDAYYASDGPAIRPAALVAEARPAESEPVRWEGGAVFPCRDGDVLAISGRQMAARRNARQYIRLTFAGDGVAFLNVLELFGDHQGVRRGEIADEAEVYALVPPGTSGCRVSSQGLATGNTVTGVTRWRSRS